MEAVLMRRPQCSRQAVVGLAILIATGLAVTASAQHTPDPYNVVGEYNLGYESSMFPVYPNGAGFVPNQGMLQGRSGVLRANQFQNYVEELDGVGSGSDTFAPQSRSRGGTEPYYRAHRQFDEAFNRIYSPNATADRTFNDDQDARTKKYLEYLRETDPKKRAKLYREYNQQSLKSARDYGSGSARAASRTGSLERPSTSIPAVSPLRRPATGGAASGRSQAGSEVAGPPSEAETPDQILERSELMDRASRPANPPSSRIPSRPAPR
jgi:hypothetical protein